MTPAAPTRPRSTRVPRKRPAKARRRMGKASGKARAASKARRMAKVAKATKVAKVGPARLAGRKGPRPLVWDVPAPTPASEPAAAPILVGLSLATVGGIVPLAWAGRRKA